MRTVKGVSESLEILHRDDHLVAVNKPAGVLVHRSPEVGETGDFLLQRLRDQIGQRVYPLHRLDRPTSGVILFALDLNTARHVAAQFRQGDVEKRYLAVVRGHAPVAGRIDHPLKRLPSRKRAPSRKQAPSRRRGRAAGGEPQAAVSDYVCLAQVELPFAVAPYPTSRYSLVALAPRTGRRHQLRRHMKHIAHPIIGDTCYGKGAHNRLFRERLEIHGLLLAAVRLDLNHPSTGGRVVIEAPLPGRFKVLLKRLGWENAWHNFTASDTDGGPCPK